MTPGKEKPNTKKSPITSPRTKPIGTVIIVSMDHAVPFWSNCAMINGPKNPRRPPNNTQPAIMNIDFIKVPIIPLLNAVPTRLPSAIVCMIPLSI